MSPALERAHSFVRLQRTGFKTIVLGTASPQGEPDASPVAAVLDEQGRFLICISGLAVHTRHLLANLRASVLLTEDEANTDQPFARRRLTLACTAQVIPRESIDYASAIAALRAKFGQAVEVITALPDFHLIRLTPQRGRLVIGFGEAYDVDPVDWSKLTPVGRPAATRPPNA